MNALSLPEQRCSAMGLSESDCDALGEECEWAEALGRCNPACASMAEDRCGAHLSCEWNGEKCAKRSGQKQDEEEGDGKPKTFTITANPDASKGAADWQGALSSKAAIWGAAAPVIAIIVIIGIVVLWFHRDGIYGAIVGGAVGLGRWVSGGVGGVAQGLRNRRDAWRAAREQRAQERADARAAEAAAAAAEDARGEESEYDPMPGLLSDSEPEDAGDDGAAVAAAAPAAPAPAHPRDLTGEVANPAFGIEPEPEPAAAPAPIPPLADPVPLPVASDDDSSGSENEYGPPPPPARTLRLDEQFGAIQDHVKAAAFADSDPEDAAGDAAREARERIRHDADTESAAAAAAAAATAVRTPVRRTRRARRRAASPVHTPLPPPPKADFNPLTALREVHKPDDDQFAAAAAERKARRDRKRAAAQRQVRATVARSEAAHQEHEEQARRAELVRQAAIVRGKDEVRDASEAARHVQDRAKREADQESAGRVRMGMRRTGVPVRSTPWLPKRRPNIRPTSAEGDSRGFARGAHMPGFTMSHVVPPETALGGGGGGIRDARDPEAVRAFLQELLGGKTPGKSRNYVRSVRRHRGGGRRQPVQIRRR